MSRRHSIPVLTVPGLWGSGPDHWQTIWERKNPGWKRIEQRDWERPVAGEWMSEFESVIGRSPEPPLIVAHSLGCIAVARWAGHTKCRVRGLFLVAPADAENPVFSGIVQGFTPIPAERVPFPVRIVLSDTDPYTTPERGRLFADLWGAECIRIGDAGHINVDSGHGPWPEGFTLFEEFRSRQDKNGI